MNTLQEYIIAYTYRQCGTLNSFFTAIRDLLRGNTKTFNKYYWTSSIDNRNNNYNMSNSKYNTLTNDNNISNISNITQAIEFYPCDRINELTRATNAEPKEICVEYVCNIHCHGDADDIETTRKAPDTAKGDEKGGILTFSKQKNGILFDAFGNKHKTTFDAEV